MIISNDKAQPSPAPTTKVGPKFTLSLRIDYGDQTRTTVVSLDQDDLLKLILEANRRELTLTDFVANLISTYARHELSAIPFTGEISIKPDPLLQVMPGIADSR